MNTSENRTHNSFRMNTCQTLNLKPFRMNTYVKTGGRGRLWLTRLEFHCGGTLPLRNPELVEAHLDVRPLLEVNGVDKTHLAVVQCQDHGRRPDAFAKKPHTLQEISVGDASASKNHLLAGRKILRIVNA